MRLLYRILCLFGRHSRGPREQTWNDGTYYRSVCRGCHARLAKGPDGWVPLERLRPPS